MRREGGWEGDSVAAEIDRGVVWCNVSRVRATGWQEMSKRGVGC